MTIPIDPKLPPAFDSTPHDQRPRTHAKWWYKPYIVTENGRYTVRCLDGGCWDRSTWIASRDDLLEALGCARRHAEAVEGARR